MCRFFLTKTTSNLSKMFLLSGGTFLFPLISTAQKIFTVRDELTKQPIEYVQVALLRINSGASTTAKGEFVLDNYALTDTVIISYLGYENKKIPVKFLVNNPLVYLVKAPVILNEVAVSAKRGSVKFHTQRIGWINNRANTFLNLSRTCIGKGTKMVVWIENKENQPGILEELIVKLLARENIKNAQPTSVRFCVFSGSQLTGPELEISSSRVVFQVTPGSQTLTIDLRKKEFYLPAQGGYVGLEWLDNTEAKLPVCVGITNSDLSTMELSNTWYSYRGKKWTRYGTGYGSDGKIHRFSNENARIDAIVAFPNK